MAKQAMHSRTRHKAPLWRALLVGMVSLALVLVSFGHRPAQAEAQAQAYILAGGNWADLCGDDDAPHPAGDRCMACVVAQGADLQGPVTSGRSAVASEAVRWPVQAVALPARVAALTHPARAPPLADLSILL